jgi:hypothetical protein
MNGNGYRHPIAFMFMPQHVLKPDMRRNPEVPALSKPSRQRDTTKSDVLRRLCA